MIFEARLANQKKQPTGPQRPNESLTKDRFLGIDELVTMPSANVRRFAHSGHSGMRNRQAVLRPIARRCRRCCRQPLCWSPGNPLYEAVSESAKVRGMWASASAMAKPPNSATAWLGREDSNLRMAESKSYNLCRQGPSRALCRHQD